jgi:hypothetical protein
LGDRHVLEIGEVEQIGIDWQSVTIGSDVPGRLQGVSRWVEIVSLDLNQSPGHTKTSKTETKQ